jgi:uncharacterized damage-inducible protein DinB
MRFTSRLFAAGSLLALAAVLAFAQGGGQAQAPRPSKSASQELLGAWNENYHKLLEMAKDFPEDKFSFKVQKDQRSFVENLLHVVGVDYMFMSSISGKNMTLAGGENPPASAYKTRADVVKLLTQAQTDGAALINAGGDAGLNKEVKSPFGNFMQHAAAAWYSSIEHSGEHYGQLVVYYRANNMVPPDSRPQPR